MDGLDGHCDSRQVTYSAHGWRQVFPAQLEEKQGLVAAHVLDV